MEEDTEMAEKKEQETEKAAGNPKEGTAAAIPKTEEPKASRQQKPAKDKTVVVLVLRKCSLDGKPLGVLRRYELPERDARELIAGGNAKMA